MTLPRPGLTIHTIGRYLPPLRGNDWWPTDTVARWREAMAMALPPELPADPRMRWAFEAGVRFREDPFQGAVTRPVMPAGMTTLDMEVLAAEDAFAQAGNGRDDITVVIQHASANANVQPANAYHAHARLGLPRACLTFGVEAENDSFLVQMALAEALLAIHGGRALLLQSSQRTHFVDPAMPWSPLVGDAATAVIVSRSGGARVLGDAHMTYSELDLPYTVGGGTDAPWWMGSVALRPTEAKRLRRHFGRALVWMIDTLDVALSQASRTSADIDVLIGHQPDGWSADVYARAFPGAQLVPNTFAQFTSLASCNLPIGLAEARARRGDLIGLTALFSGGIGNIASALIIDWSRP